ncbi:hypothetical protein T05_9884 [Trichinella murrelli]|uniref:Uncharacterized protein n=1 Tax=Trichinella murrelli TaxID=144512 RepID=A0A0V0U2W1_9BILA|nr:hypothetical protein T05_9884 [Trichinella murrelli]
MALLEMITLAVLWNSLQRYDDVWIMFGQILTERHVGVTLIFQVSLSTLLYIDSRLSNTQLSHQKHFNYGRNFGLFVENAFSAPVRKLILILRPLWEKIRNAKLIITKMEITLQIFSFVYIINEKFTAVVKLPVKRCFNVDAIVRNDFTLEIVFLNCRMHLNGVVEAVIHSLDSSSVE